MSKKLKAACIQIQAMDVANYLEAERQILDRIVEACEKGADLIILPECAYPSYYAGNDPLSFSRAMEHFNELAYAISEQALKYRVHVASGFLSIENDCLYNMGILWGPDGKEVGRVRKSNMWHFDSKYVGYGKDFDVWDTEIGKIGMIICADGRAPEITRILALRGAEIIIDMANLVTTGRDPSSLSNPQVEYMLPARARENGVWFLMADKVGLEAGTVLNTGLSCIIDPFGNVLIKASSDKPETIMTDIVLDGKRPSIPSRKSQLYGALVRPHDELSVTAMMSEYIFSEKREVFSSVVHFSYSSTSEYIEKAIFFTRILEDQGSSLIMLPSLRDNIPIPEIEGRLRTNLSSPDVIVALSGYANNGDVSRRSASLFTIEGNLGYFFANHGGSFSSNSPLVPLKTSSGNLAVMFDEEGLVPEVSRCFMLEGTEILLWFDVGNSNFSEIISRTRASENRVFLMRNGICDGDSHGIIIAPSGQVTAASIPGKDQAVSSLLLRSLVRSKSVVPGTDVVLGRRPELYQQLVR